MLKNTLDSVLRTVPSCSSFEPLAHWQVPIKPFPLEFVPILGVVASTA